MAGTAMEVDAFSAIEIQLQQHLAFQTHHFYGGENSSTHQTHFPNLHETEEFDLPDVINCFCSNGGNPLLPSIDEPAYLLAAESASGSPVVCDPLLYLNIHPQGCYFPDMRGCRGDEGLYQEEEWQQQKLENGGVAELGLDIMPCNGRGEVGKTKTSERQRRQDLSIKFMALKKLIPNQTKNERASVLEGAIEHIKDLLQTVDYLKSAIDKKRCSNMELLGDPDMSHNGSVRASCIRRKSNDTEVNVHVVDDEVTIELVWRKKNNCLFSMSKVLDELHLDVHHVSGGHIGGFCSFMFSTKIYEGTNVHASAIADKLIEGIERQ